MLVPCEDVVDCYLCGTNFTPPHPCRYLSKDDLNTAMVAGDYDMVLSETWGAPYDPHR